MGRTIPSYRIASEMEIWKWRTFRKLLDKQDRKVFDERTMMDPVELKSNFESKCSIRIETNSRGYNTSIHGYQGVTEIEIDDTIFRAIYGIYGLQKELVSLESLRK
jgi:hypothetical protein